MIREPILLVAAADFFHITVSLFYWTPLEIVEFYI